jgi:beta-N-acetylhexosaminidase
MDTNVRFRGIRLFWQRQVSPAPQTATFNDVPTTHPFHRFIEALYASGITGGCGNGNFCPDEPVTRGQMAVFLSGALGLHWAP